MTKLEEAAKMALEALWYAEIHHGGDDCYTDSITALRAALADPAKEREAQRVRKIGGSFQHTGTVLSKFTTTSGEVRLVVEFDPPVKGMLHIYRPDQVEPIESEARK